MKTLYLIRGIPGSGKSTLAQKLEVADLTQKVSACHVEADMYHIDQHGNYNWKPQNIHASHEWCQLRTENLMADETQHIYVANTFTRRWEMEEYKRLAERFGYAVVEIIMHSDFDNIHDVPGGTVEKMRKRFEY